MPCDAAAWWMAGAAACVATTGDSIRHNATTAMTTNGSIQRNV
ncbi:MAG: hypothetical protein WCD86_01110 [Ktedonobacteraceae bacterium]